MKKGINRQLQADYVDKLSRPSNRTKTERALDKEDPKTKTKDFVEKPDDTMQIDQEREKQKEALNTSFADMDDKEFAKMIKKIEARAKKGRYTKFASNEVEGGMEAIMNDQLGINASPYKNM
mmetsp:Transcript_11226/g.16381  ORF Transcript_11226/g.16381 Transcript_11226/m.16381 type:complete len:122 (+) Transcript_11226:39-404(+)